MATRADELIDRRRLRRKLTFWRVVTLVVVAAAIAASSYWLTGERVGGASASHIANLRIEGAITEDRDLLRRIERIGASPMVEGVIVTINSPGGTTVGGEAIYEAIRKLSEQKPVVAQVGTLAASAGYMIASAADHIVARQSSIVGSIGVLVQYPDITVLMENLGIAVDGVKSTPLKAEPSPFTPTTEEEREMLRALVMDSYDWFVGLVRERRPLTPAELRRVSDGSIFTGRQALELKLVDALGGQEEAIAWLATREVDPDLPVVEWRERSSGGFFSLLGAADVAGRLFGLDQLGPGLARALGGDRIFLDGLLSVWHPAPAVAE